MLKRRNQQTNMKEKIHLINMYFSAKIAEQPVCLLFGAVKVNVFQINKKSVMEGVNLAGKVHKTLTPPKISEHYM